MCSFSYYNVKKIVTRYNMILTMILTILLTIVVIFIVSLYFAISQCKKREELISFTPSHLFCMTEIKQSTDSCLFVCLFN